MSLQIYIENESPDKDSTIDVSSGRSKPTILTQPCYKKMVTMNFVDDRKYIGKRRYKYINAAKTQKINITRKIRKD